MNARYLDLGVSSERHHHHDHSIGNETTLDNPVKEIVQMEKIPLGTSRRSWRQIAQRRAFARCLTVKIRYTNFQTITRSAPSPAPTCFRQRNL